MRATHMATTAVTAGWALSGECGPIWEGAQTLWIISAPIRWWYDPFISGSKWQTWLSRKRHKLFFSLCQGNSSTYLPLLLFPIFFNFRSCSSGAGAVFQSSATGAICCSLAPSLSPFLPEGNHISLPALPHLCPDATLQLCQYSKVGMMKLGCAKASLYLCCCFVFGHIFTVKAQKQLGDGALVMGRSRRGRRKSLGVSAAWVQLCSYCVCRARLQSNLGLLLVINVEWWAMTDIKPTSTLMLSMLSLSLWDGFSQATVKSLTYLRVLWCHPSQPDPKCSWNKHQAPYFALL